MFTWLRSHKLLLSILLILGFASWYFFGHQNQPTYTQYTVTRGSVSETLELSGKITAENQAVLRFPAGGLVTYLGAKEGDTVKKWQTLASLDTRQLQKTLEQKLNLYAIERGEFDQNQDDYEKNIDDGDIDKELRRLLQKNQYQLDNTVKDVEYLDLSLKLSRLTSPLAGLLTQAPITTLGTQVLATDTWIVVDPSSLYLSADLDEIDLKRVKVGQKVQVTLDAYPDQTVDSTVASISFNPKETSSGTTYEVKVYLPAEFLTNLRLGLNGTAAIILTQKDSVLTLPSNALTPKNGGAVVLVKSGRQYTEKTVETGIENGGIVEIVSGLGEQDHVYTAE